MKYCVATIECVYCFEPELRQTIDRLRSQYGKAEVVPEGKEVVPGLPRDYFCYIGVSKVGKQYKVFLNRFKVWKK